MNYGADLVPVYPWVVIGTAMLTGLVVAAGIRLAARWLRV